MAPLFTLCQPLCKGYCPLGWLLSFFQSCLSLSLSLSRLRLSSFLVDRPRLLRLIACNSTYCPSLSLLSTQSLTELTPHLPSFRHAFIIHQHPFRARILCPCMAYLSYYCHILTFPCPHSPTLPLPHRQV